MSRSRLAARLLACSLLAAVAACDDGPKTVEGFLKQADAHRAEGNLRASIIDLRNAIQKAPDDPKLHLRLGEAYLEVGDGLGAEKEARATADAAAGPKAVLLARAQLMQGRLSDSMKTCDAILQPGDADPAAPPPPPVDARDQASLYGVRAQNLLTLGNRVDAHAAIDKAAALDPKNHELLLAQTRDALLRGDMGDAKARLAQLGDPLPNDFLVQVLAGDVSYAAGDYAASEKYFGGVLKLTNGRLSARVGLARAQLAQGNSKSAIENLDGVLKQAPGDVTANYIRSVAAYEAKDYPAAKSYSEKALSSLGSHLPSLLIAGISSLAVGQFEQANRYLSRFVTDVPDNVPARRALATAQMRLGQSGAAVATLKPAVNGPTVDAGLLDQIGTAAIQSGDLASGGVYLQQALDKAPDNANIRAKLGLARIALGEGEAGLKDLEGAVDTDPSLQQAEVALVVAHLREKRYDQAMEVANKLRERLPKDPLGPYLAGVVDVTTGKLEEGKAEFVRAIELKPDNFQAMTMLASVAVLQKDVEGAAAQLNRILAIDPNNITTLMRLALLDINNGRHAEAREMLNRAIVAAPKESIPRAYLAQLMLGDGEPQSAIEVAAEGLRNEPTAAALLEIKGRAELSAGKPADAVNTFSTLSSSQPQSVQARLLLANAYAAIPNQVQQRAILREVMSLNPTDLNARAEIARALARAGDDAGSQDVLAKLRKEFPDRNEVTELAGDLALINNKPKDAVTAYTALWKALPNPGTTAKLASAMWQSDAKAQAVSLLEKWIADHEADVLTRQQLGEYRILTGDYDLAITQFTDLLQRAPNTATAHNNLAWLLNRKGQNDEALKHARRALELQPNNPAIMDTVATILLAQNEPVEALSLLKSAKERTKDPSVSFHLAQALTKTGDRDAARDLLTAVLQDKTEFAERPQAVALMAELNG